MAAQVFGKVRQTFGPSEDSFRAVAGDEIMQSGKSGYLRYALPVIVAAAVIEIPQEFGRGVALLRKPLFERQRIEFAPRFVCRRQGYRNGENLFAVAAVSLFQTTD